MKLILENFKKFINEEVDAATEQEPVYDEITGSKMWKLNGKLHREDGPAVVGPKGLKEWYLNGKRHREDGPAVIKGDGSKYWFLNGELHREDGPAIVKADGPHAGYHGGKKEWFLKGKRHRVDGPAMELPAGYKEWWVNGIRHREDGPAIQPAPGSRLKKKWYLNGEYYGASSSPPQKWLAAGGRARTEGEVSEAQSFAPDSKAAKAIENVKKEYPALIGKLQIGEDDLLLIAADAIEGSLHGGAGGRIDGDELWRFFGSLEEFLKQG